MTLLGLFCELRTSDRQKKPKHFRVPSNEHSYPIWFELALWFQATPVLTSLCLFFPNGIFVLGDYLMNILTNIGCN
jgi:hypothetical protein